MRQSPPSLYAMSAAAASLAVAAAARPRLARLAAGKIQPGMAALGRTSLSCPGGAATSAPLQKRCSSHSPLGAEPQPAVKKISLPTLAKMHARGEPITMLTAHDFPSAMVADQAGIEMILVGDSLAMVALGMQDTSEVLLEEMLLHCRSVSRAVKGAVTVCHCFSCRHCFSCYQSCFALVCLARPDPACSALLHSPRLLPAPALGSWPC